MAASQIFRDLEFKRERGKKKCFAPAGKRNWEREGNPTEVIQPCDARRWGRETVESGNIVVDASLTAWGISINRLSASAAP